MKHIFFITFLFVYISALNRDKDAWTNCSYWRAPRIESKLGKNLEFLPELNKSEMFTISRLTKHVLSKSPVKYLRMTGSLGTWKGMKHLIGEVVFLQLFILHVISLITISYFYDPSKSEKNRKIVSLFKKTTELNTLYCIQLMVK
jgi:hypothetical protein